MGIGVGPHCFPHWVPAWPGRGEVIIDLLRIGWAHRHSTTELHPLRKAFVFRRPGADHEGSSAMGLPEAVDLLHTLSPMLSGNLVQPVEEGHDHVVPDKGTPFPGSPPVAELELVSKPLDNRLALPRPRGKGENLGYRGRGVVAGDIEKTAHELQSLGRLA